MMSTDWVTFREFIGLVIYLHVNVAVNPPPKFNDDRLNQRLDLHYLALDRRGNASGYAGSGDEELAAVISPHAHLIGNPGEL